MVVLSLNSHFYFKGISKVSFVSYTLFLYFKFSLKCYSQNIPVRYIKIYDHLLKNMFCICKLFPLAFNRLDKKNLQMKDFHKSQGTSMEVTEKSLFVSLLLPRLFHVFIILQKVMVYFPFLQQGRTLLTKNQRHKPNKSAVWLMFQVNHFT